jgi:hypothetical protein
MAVDTMAVEESVATNSVAPTMEKRALPTT